MKRDKGYCSVFGLDASETVDYNNPLFPVYVRYGFLSSYPDYSAISHWHEDLEFILVKKGNMTYSVNGELVGLTENQGIMVNSRQLHYGFSAAHEECEFICILLSTELLQGNQWFYENYVERITHHAAYPYLCLGNEGWQRLLLEELEEIYRLFGAQAMPDSSYFEVFRCFINVMKILYDNMAGKDWSSEKESLELVSLKNMLRYIEEHYWERVTLADIALAGACCKSRCSLLFKKYLRDTPIIYTTRLRLRKSLVALLESDKSITDIAYECGFGATSYYCETFQKYYRESPLQYRKRRDS